MSRTYGGKYVFEGNQNETASILGSPEKTYAYLFPRAQLIFLLEGDLTVSLVSYAASPCSACWLPILAL